jgi:hypothetical protein
METQKFMGRNEMLARLGAQVGSAEEAVKILQARGHLEADGKTFTAAGAKRDAMTAEERALDRAHTRTGRPASSFKYSPTTNRATNKKKY